MALFVHVSPGQSQKSRRTEWQRCRRDNAWSGWVLLFGRIEAEGKDAGRRPAVRKTLASISLIAGIGAGDDSSEAPRAVSHLRRSRRLFLRTQPLRAGLTSAAPTALSYLSDSAELFFVFELSYLPYFS
jgi:hypothetical protein